jgi:N6-L-threonylcarbamoyladenine synthase
MMKKPSICLGIECTAHTFGIGIIDEKGKTYCNIKQSFVTEHGGMIPHDVSKHHESIKEIILQDALEKSKLKLEDISIVAFSQSPGLPPTLIVGKNFAKELKERIERKTKKKIQIVGVNHCIAHLEIGRLLTKAKDPVMLYASGANTQIIAYEAKKYRIFGETLDQGIGNAIDSFGRYINLGFPAGPKIEELAKKGKSYIELPYAVKGMDVSFSGILTKLKQLFDSKKNRNEDLAYSMQETMFSMLVEVSERAMAHCGKKELLLGGGVACNKRLQEMCKIMCKERKAKFFCPENQFLVDNGLMIAWLGILEHKSGYEEEKNVDIKPYLRTDEIEVRWRK